MPQIDSNLEWCGITWNKIANSVVFDVVFTIQKKLAMHVQNKKMYCNRWILRRRELGLGWKYINATTLSMKFFESIQVTINTFNNNDNNDDDENNDDNDNRMKQA